MGASESFDRDLRLRLPGLVGTPVTLHPAAASGRAVLIARLIGVVAGDCLVLHRQPVAGELPSMQPGQRLVARLVAGDVMLRFCCVVTRVLAAPLNQIQLAWPTEVRTLQLRCVHRIPADLPATATGDDGGARAVQVVDFSASGCRLVSTRSLGVRGAALRLQFHLTNRPAAAAQSVPAIIQWLHWSGSGAAPAAGVDPAHYAYGLRFEPGAPQRQLLQDLAGWLRMESVAVGVRTGPALAPTPG